MRLKLHFARVARIGALVLTLTLPSAVAATMAFAYLPAPTQSTPSNGASGVSTAPTFSWSAVSGADAGYRIMVASSSGVLPTDPTVSTCSGCVINDTPSGTSYTPAAGVLSGGTTYYWEVHARSSTTYGLWSDIWSFTTASPVPLPTATTNSATKVTWSSATLNGTVNPNGSSTTAYFQWGTSTSYGNTTSSQSIGSGASSVAISANLSSLTAGTTYHFRVVATNSAGTAYGADATFKTTSTGKPTATTNSATKVTWSSATLNGTVNPNGSSTTAYFQWGTSTSYGNTTSSQSIGSGASSVAISANLSSLTAGTTYHFRMVATNSAGTAYGADATFATVLEGVDYLRTQSPSTDRCIRNAGKFFVGRYYDDSGGKSAKCLVQEEAAQLHKAGLKIGTFYETCGGSTCCGCPGPSYFRYNQGVYDAQQAKARAKDAGQAAGAPIFFAVDYDATNVDLSRGIAQYFKGVASGMKGAYPIGVYGSYSVIEYAQANWPNVTHYWQTYAWSYGKRSDYAMAYQYLNGYVLCGVNLDLDREYQEVTW